MHEASSYRATAASAPRTLRRWPFALFGLATLLALVVACVHRSPPPLPRELSLSLVFPPSNPGHPEPIVAAGARGQADFLVVNYLDETTATFSYDHWGSGGPTSAPVTLQPGRRQSLRLVLPALTAVRGSPTAPLTTTAPLLLEFEGREILREDVAFHLREPAQIFFGQNPIGGTSSGAVFRGKIHLPNHHVLRGSPTALFSTTELLHTWATTRPGEVAAITFLAFLAAWLAHRFGTTLHRRRSTIAAKPMNTFAVHRRPPHAWFLGTAAACALVFSWVITGGTFRFIFPESFGNFYDYQAASLLAGRLDVPEAAIQGEAFVHGGKIYGYFGPTPALLRLPLTLVGVGFGSLSRTAMLVYYVATLLGAYCVLRHAVRLLRPAFAEPTAWETILFTAHVGLGTTTFFLGSRAYIYHEAILCGILFAVWSCWCAFRFLEKPDSRWWLGALVLGTLSVHARPPTGLFALTVLGCVAAAQLFRLPFSLSPRRSLLQSRRPIVIGLLAIGGVASFNALSYAKFRTIEGCPLRLNVQYHAARLAHINGKQFHFSNLRYGLDTYLLRPRVAVTPNFPWLYQDSLLDPQTYPGAKLDLPDRTLALPVGMLGLFLLSTAGCAWLVWRDPAACAPVTILWLSFIPLTLALCAAIATAERYTGDFVPLLICAGAFGLVALARRPVFIALFAAATLWSCALTAAVTVHYQGKMIWGVADGVPERYEQLRDRVDAFFHAPPRPSA